MLLEILTQTIDKSLLLCNNIIIINKGADLCRFSKRRIILICVVLDVVEEYMKRNVHFIVKTVASILEEAMLMKKQNVFIMDPGIVNDMKGKNAFRKKHLL